MIEVLNPFGRAVREGLDLNALLAHDPDAGAAVLDRLCAETAAELRSTLANPCFSVSYRLVGAEPRYCTPMQYGGFYLERDRDLLTSAKGKGVIELIVEGKDAYLDFVSDLPADKVTHVQETANA